MKPAFIQTYVDLCSLHGIELKQVGSGWAAFRNGVRLVQARKIEAVVRLLRAAGKLD